MEMKILPGAIGGLCALSITLNAAEIDGCESELTREMYRHSWRAHLSETWKCADIKARTWWKARMYERSIFEVIPQAIADCITHNAEFDEKNSQIYRTNGR